MKLMKIGAKSGNLRIWQLLMTIRKLSFSDLWLSGMHNCVIITLRLFPLQNCGFVTFDKAGATEQAINEHNGNVVEGIHLKVSLARRQPVIDPINDASSSAKRRGPVSKSRWIAACMAGDDPTQKRPGPVWRPGELWNNM